MTLYGSKKINVTFDNPIFLKTTYQTIKAYPF